MMKNGFAGLLVLSSVLGSLSAQAFTFQCTGDSPSYQLKVQSEKAWIQYSDSLDYPAGTHLRVLNSKEAELAFHLGTKVVIKTKNTELTITPVKGGEPCIADEFTGQHSAYRASFKVSRPGQNPGVANYAGCCDLK